MPIAWIWNLCALVGFATLATLALLVGQWLADLIHYFTTYERLDRRIWLTQLRDVAQFYLVYRICKVARTADHWYATHADGATHVFFDPDVDIDWSR